MYKDILPLLCCPMCGRGLELEIVTESEDDVIDGRLVCNCGQSFPIVGGVADFNSKEQENINNWEDMSRDSSFEKLDREMDRKNPAEVERVREKVLNAIVAAAAASERGPVLDIASGRGLLLRELAMKLPAEMSLISVDLSSFVLRYDRERLKKLAPDRKISFLACDASALPINQGAVDIATTYGGFSNMPECASAALREAHRVLHKGGLLVDSFVVIDRNSEGFRVLSEFFEKQNISDAEMFYLEDGVTEAHSSLFARTVRQTVHEGIGVDNGMDLLPYPGEWYAEQVYVSEKGEGVE